MGEKHLCEVCNKNEIVGVCCVPGIPYSAGYCAECLKANAHPWHILVAQVACLGGMEKTADWVKQMVECTCKHLDKTMEQFEADVQVSLKQMDEYFEGPGKELEDG